MKRYVAGLAVITAINVTQVTLGADVGAPLYLNTIGKSGSIEVYYESYKRDVTVTDDLGTPYLPEQEENRYIGRINYHASDRASLYVEVGATDSQGSEGTAPIFGGGLKINLHNTPAFSASLFGSISYINEIEYKSDGFIDYANSLEYPSRTQKETYYEINGGLILSRVIALDAKSTITPYAGVMLSKLDGDEEIEFEYPVSGRTVDVNGEMEEDELFSAFAGLSLLLDSTWGIRLEGRFVNQTSVSAGLSMFF